MKYFLIVFFALYSHSVFCQSAIPSIKANEAYKHIGEVVVVCDSLSGYQIFKDSTTVMQFGPKGDPHPLFVSFTTTDGRPMGLRLVNLVKNAKVRLKGLIIAVNNNPLIILTDLNELRTDQHPW